jgi:cytochrome P450/NADPH-cytochrome P450 reductase
LPPIHARRLTVVGHHDWAQTFHKIPKLVEASLAAHGGTQICGIGLTDCAKGEMFADFEQWADETFWPAMANKYGATSADADGKDDAMSASISVEFSTPRKSALRQDVNEATVVEIKELSVSGASKKHIEIQLPSGEHYTSGDYLAVLPLNSKDSIARVMRRFRLAWDAHVTITATALTTLPTGSPVSVSDILGAYVELAQPATKRVCVASNQSRNRVRPTAYILTRIHRTS